MPTHIYTNQAGNLGEFETECVKLDAEGFVVDFGLAWWERVPIAMPALERPRMQQMLRRLRPGDTVVTFHLRNLGASLREVLGTVARLRTLGVRLLCIEAGNADLTVTDSPVCRALEAANALEQSTRSARMKASAEQAAQRGARLGRRPALPQGTQDDVREALRQGTSVSELARRLQVSRQTIMRIRDAQR
ncbi:recombinase family protein [Cupriavidus agavae]|uniref:Putative DNA-invertase from lambdoid prophage Rac n=1 Tax=Cupriavidus agavae TaxID=1001822 RepID=A0A4Q7S953_9BURK|nr:recombinase family protein [Cupriavidus agavae]RZT42487.1 putative DNA-invertase from lambdoid prophage Rac [Cupriavidus agavae]